MTYYTNNPQQLSELLLTRIIPAKNASAKTIAEFKKANQIIDKLMLTKEQWIVALRNKQIKPLTPIVRAS